jgi:hypothetical protein
MSAFNIFLFIILGVIIVILGYYVYLHYFGEQTNTANSTLWLNNDNVAATNASFTYTKIVNPTSTAYTFSMWLYINSWPTGGNANIFNCKSVAGDKNYLSVNLPDSTPTLNCVIATDKNNMGDAGNQNTIVITNNLGIQRWVNVVISVNANIVDCYIDGKLVTSQQLNSGSGMSPTTTIATNFSKASSSGSGGWNVNFGTGLDIYISNFKRTAVNSDPATVAMNYSVKPSGAKSATTYSGVLQINKNNQPVSYINIF